MKGQWGYEKFKEIKLADKQEPLPFTLIQTSDARLKM